MLRGLIANGVAGEGSGFYRRGIADKNRNGGLATMLAARLSGSEGPTKARGSKFVVPLSAADEASIIAQMEKDGEAQVRLRIAGGNWPPHLNQIAMEWLSKKDQESERLKEASHGEQISIARAAKDAAVVASGAAVRAAAAAERQALAAERANTRATIALIIAIVSIIIAAATTSAPYWIGGSAH